MSLPLAPWCSKCKSNDWGKNVTGITIIDDKQFEEISMRCCRCMHEVHFMHDVLKPLVGWNIHELQPDELVW